jgi:TM2 domain-containing membrane protein YozV
MKKERIFKMNDGIIVILALYFLPAFVAAVRFHPNKTAIFVLNLLLGWTFLGWIAALIWSSTFVAPWSGSVQDTARDPRWANLRSTPMPKISDRYLYLGMKIWVVCLVIIVGLIIFNRTNSPKAHAVAAQATPAVPARARVQSKQMDCINLLMMIDRQSGKDLGWFPDLRKYEAACPER